MRDWLSLPLANKNKEVDEAIITDEDDTNKEQESVPSWFTILNVFSIAKKIKKQGESSQTQPEPEPVVVDEQIVVIEQPNDDYTLHRTLSSSSIATSTDTEHSTPANSEMGDTTTNNKYFNHPNLLTNIKICWNHGGKKVQVTGEFDNWSVSINMIQDTEDIERYFVEIPMELTKDIEYKFVVDGEWKYAVDLPHRCDWRGNINNVIYKKQNV